MQFKFFTIPAVDHVESTEELNSFLRSSRTLTVNKEFVADGMSSFWALAVEYLDADKDGNGASRRGRNKVDYKELLSAEEFTTFARLRDWRKEIAGQEAVPVYTIFTNEQLAEIVRRRITTKTGLKEIDGIGEARVSKYGSDVIKIMTGEIVA